MQKLISQSWARFVPLLLVLVIAACSDTGPSVDLSASTTTPDVNASVTLTATASDFEGTNVVYAYEVITPSDSDITITSTTGTATFVPTEATTYTVQVTATSGSESATDTVNITAGGGTDGGEPSVTLAPSPAAPAVGDDVTLTATPTGFDGDVSYEFAVTGPDGADVTVTEGEGAEATFTADAEGTYTATVTATSDDDESVTATSTPVTITAGGDGTTTGPTPATQLSADPTALAVDESTTLTALSSDFDGNVTYNFAVEDSDGTAVTEGEVVPGTGDADNTAVFTPTEAGTYTATVTVADADDASVEATSNEVTIDVAADAASVTPGDADVILSANPTSVELGGGDDEVSLTTAISNFGEDTVAYAYEVTVPEGADAVTIDSTDSTASFTPTAAGDYTVVVTATGGENAPTDEVTIIVTEEPDTGNGGTELTLDSFGVSNASDGTYLNDEDGAPAEADALQVSTPGEFFIQVEASAPSGSTVDTITIQLRNVDTDTPPDGNNNPVDLEVGTEVQGFTLNAPDCTLPAESVTCTYRVEVSAAADETNLTAGEYAYVFRPQINGQDFTALGSRGYVSTAATN